MNLCLTLPKGHLNHFEVKQPILFAEAPMLRDVPEYAWLFNEYRGAVIVDNSPFQVGVYSGYGDPTLSFQELLGIVKTHDLRHPIVVLPDVLNDSQATLIQAKASIRVLEDLFPPLTAPRTCFVVQGKNYDDWFDCLLQAQAQFQPDMIGIPYSIEFRSPSSLLSREMREIFRSLRLRSNTNAWTWAMNRAELVLCLQQHYLMGSDVPDKVHLFGLGHPVELTFYTGDRASIVYSLDTTLPFVAAAEGLCFDDGVLERFYGVETNKPIWTGDHILSEDKQYSDEIVALFLRNRAAMYRALLEGAYHSIVSKGGVL